ncbi:MAG: hypothetical protein ABSC55_25490 [Syntrophorhabdales bacterium]
MAETLLCNPTGAHGNIKYTMVISLASRLYPAAHPRKANLRLDRLKGSQARPDTVPG